MRQIFRSLCDSYNVPSFHCEQGSVDEHLCLIELYITVISEHLCLFEICITPVSESDAFYASYQSVTDDC